MQEDLKPGISQGSLDEEEEEGKDIGSKSVKADGKGEERAAFVSGLGGTLKVSLYVKAYAYLQVPSVLLYLCLNGLVYSCVCSTTI